MAQAAEAFPAVFDAYVPTRAGELDRLPGGVGRDARGRGRGGEDARHRFYVCYEEGGRIDGYAVYRVAGIDPADHYRRGVFLEELCSVSDAGYACFVEVPARDRPDRASCARAAGPVDEPLRYLLEDQRQLRTLSWGDRTWVRLVDVAGRTGRRRYEEEGELVIEVEDPFCPWNEGRFRLSVDGDGARHSWSASTHAPISSFRSAALGLCIWAGPRSAAWPRWAASRSGSTARARRADRMFRGPATAVLHDQLLSDGVISPAGQAGATSRARRLRSVPARTTWAPGATLADELHEVRVAGEEQHLMMLGGVGERLGDRGRTARDRS